MGTRYASDVNRVALPKSSMSRRSAQEGWRARMLLTVHDELVFETPPALAAEIGAALKQEMEGVYTLDVPREVDIGIADNWADA